MSLSTNTNMEDVLCAAFDENNLGVVNLQQGRYEEALKHFKGAAQLMYKVTQHNNTSTSSSSSSSSTTSSSSSSSSSSETSATLTNEQTPTSAHQQQEQQQQQQQQQPLPCPSTMPCDSILCDRTLCLVEGSFLCDCPIVMQRHPNNRTSATCTLESATILYNMGLTYHLNFIRVTESLEHALSNALTLYEMAYNLGMQIPNSVRSSQIVMASLNNLGQLHHELGDFGRSRFFLEELSSYIMSLENPPQHEIALERHEFMLNVMVLREPQGAPAA